MEKMTMEFTALVQATRFCYTAKITNGGDKHPIYEVEYLEQRKL